ncbi:family 43 glycosylhydrolase [Mucilaginibacter sp. UR6-1]|uniref:family 43 glycosylhydrolase n=1 Tax=Mucilaginibacter sp. UR6-1 TaxID=1435643 RepID=UPI001E4E7ACB|nr:family 43 glycosylhydrolase [Mucilaginibacter sp. UR6-1]MCC8410113.1 family 43 glycosylhydrolase [Mucilaginibacter sp. UR6-1]
MMVKNTSFFKIVILTLILFAGYLPAYSQPQKVNQKYSAYLFAYFTGNQKNEEAIHFALSADGYHYRALNQDKPILNSAKISESGGVRDPHIVRGADGKTFYMVATDMVSDKGWDSNRAMVLLKSTDLVNWSSSVVNIQKRFKGNDSLMRVWAPQTIYDAAKGKYLIYWSMKHGLRGRDIIYYAYANAAFTDLEGEPKQLFFSPDKGSCIDGEIVNKDGLFYLFYKTEGANLGINIAISTKLTEGYKLQSVDVQQTKEPVEGSGVFKLNDGSGYILMYDVYASGRYQFTKSTDFKTFKVVDGEVSMNFHPRHGTVMPITTAEAQRLAAKWMSAEDVLLSATNPALKTINTKLDTAAKTLELAVRPGTSLKAFNPQFTTFPGIMVTPKTADLSKGPKIFTVTIKGKAPVKYKVSAVENHNPVLAGYYADPDILYAEKTGRFYLYPTSDGFTGWSGKYFKTFSSPDMVNWKDEGVIIDLPKDIKWAKRNAWAPCIVEKKINGAFKYFYYFTAAQKIGVAVADDPAGPFVDSGKPLIDAFPDGITGGQQIDPDVFSDPKTGKSYLYWGNGYMAGAELSDDMVSLKQGTTKVLKPGKDYREGTYVFYREGKYYFMWSEDDTRSPDYRVAYGVADSPLGEIIIPQNSIILKKDALKGIYGTGHNSVIQIPGTDEWYIVYHRFNYPKGITMGDAAGYNREVCIDRLYFNADGTIKQVIPTHTGIKPVSVKK